MNKLFKQLKSGKQDVQSKSFPIPSTPPKKAEKKMWQKPLFAQSGFGGPWTPQIPSEEAFVSLCKEIVDEMDVGSKLLGFCWKLDVFQTLCRGGNAFAQLAEETREGSEEGDSGIAPLIRRYCMSK